MNLKLLAFLAFHLLTEDESKLAETQFRYIAQRALVEAKHALLARRWAGVTMADVVAELYPRASQWPFVEWLGFEQVVRSMLFTSYGNDMDTYLTWRQLLRTLRLPGGCYLT